MQLYVTLFLLYAVVIMEILLVYSSKFEFHAVACYFMVISDTATKIYHKLAPVYSDNMTYTRVKKARSSLTDILIFMREIEVIDL